MTWETSRSRSVKDRPIIKPFDGLDRDEIVAGRNGRRLAMSFHSDLKTIMIVKSIRKGFGIAMRTGSSELE